MSDRTHQDPGGTGPADENGPECDRENRSPPDPDERGPGEERAPPAPQPRPTHLDAAGRAQMVDVGAKAVTRRTAVAEGALRMSPATLAAFTEGTTPKGEAMAIARVAGIQAGKRTDLLIPLCHALPGASVSVEFEPDVDLPGIRVVATTRYLGQTGVEMEALTAASVALLTLYDMAKAMDRGMVVESVRLRSKEGGASGRWSV